MTLNKKLTRNIILCFLALLLLSGAYYFALKWDPQSDTVQKTEKTEQITVFETTDILSAQISNEGGSYTIKKTDASYTIEGMENSDLLTSSLDSTMRNLKKITADRIINIDEKKLADFGLSEPLALLKINTADGKQQIIKIGTQAPTGDGRYVMTDSSDKIYLVPSYASDYFLKTAQSYLNTVIATVDTSSVNEFELYNGDECITKIRQKQSTDTLKNELANSPVMEKPYYEYVSAERLNKVLENISQIKAISIIENSLSNAEKYGIGKYTIKLTDKSASHILKLGNSHKDGEVYAVYEGKDIIYSLDSAFIKLVESFEPFEYISKLVQIYNIDTVSKLEYTSSQGNHILEIDRSDTDKPVYTINSVKTTDTAFKTAYQSIIGIMFTSVPTESYGKQIGSVTFTFTDGSIDTAEYFEYDERNYAVRKSDGSTYCILKKNFDKVFDDINTCVTF